MKNNAIRTIRSEEITIDVRICAALAANRGSGEVYLAAIAPVPMATWGNHEQSHVGQNYLRSLFALGFQGFLILICVAIYAVLLQNVAISGDAINSIWSIVGYTVLLCFTLFKTGSVARSILGAH